MAGKFEIKKPKNDKYFFSLLAGNGQAILSSEIYEAKASALNGIESVKRMPLSMVGMSALKARMVRRILC